MTSTAPLISFKTLPESCGGAWWEPATTSDPPILFLDPCAHIGLSLNSLARHVGWTDDELADVRAAVKWWWDAPKIAS